jgi:hypothetical protein
MARCQSPWAAGTPALRQSRAPFAANGLPRLHCLGGRSMPGPGAARAVGRSGLRRDLRPRQAAADRLCRCAAMIRAPSPDVAAAGMLQCQGGDDQQGVRCAGRFGLPSAVRAERSAMAPNRRETGQARGWSESLRVSERQKVSAAVVVRPEARRHRWSRLPGAATAWAAVAR